MKLTVHWKLLKNCSRKGKFEHQPHVTFGAHTQPNRKMFQLNYSLGHWSFTVHSVRRFKVKMKFRMTKQIRAYLCFSIQRSKRKKYDEKWRQPLLFQAPMIGARFHKKVITNSLLIILHLNIYNRNQTFFSYFNRYRTSRLHRSDVEVNKKTQPFRFLRAYCFRRINESNYCINLENIFNCSQWIKLSIHDSVFIGTQN